MLQLIFVILMMTDKLVIMHLLGLRHCIILDVLQETLSLDDIVLEDKTT
jgi:hypothetical protein